MNNKLSKIRSMLFMTAMVFVTMSILEGCGKKEVLPSMKEIGSTKHGTGVDEFLRTVGDKSIDGVEQVKKILGAGISPNTTDVRGDTALMYAIAAGKTNMASFLIERGADVEHVASGGVTPLLVACSSDDNVWAVRLLVAKGANINHATDIGTTPLMRSAQWGFTTTTEVLLELGADISKTNMLGQTAAELAWTAGHQELAKTIFEARPPVSTGTPPHTLTRPIPSEEKR